MAGGIGGRLDDRTISAWIQNAKAGAAEKKKLFDGGGLFYRDHRGHEQQHRCHQERAGLAPMPLSLRSSAASLAAASGNLGRRMLLYYLDLPA